MTEPTLSERFLEHLEQWSKGELDWMPDADRLSLLQTERAREAVRLRRLLRAQQIEPDLMERQLRLMLREACVAAMEKRDAWEGK